MEHVAPYRLVAGEQRFGEACFSTTSVWKGSSIISDNSVSTDEVLWSYMLQDTTRHDMTLTTVTLNCGTYEMTTGRKSGCCTIDAKLTQCPVHMVAVRV